VLGIWDYTVCVMSINYLNPVRPLRVPNATDVITKTTILLDCFVNLVTLTE